MGPLMTWTWALSCLSDLTAEVRAADSRLEVVVMNRCSCLFVVGRKL